MKYKWQIHHHRKHVLKEYYYATVLHLLWIDHIFATQLHKMDRFFGINWDFAGFSASLICALHCVLTPVFISLGVSSSAYFLHDHSFDIIILAIGLIVALFSLFKDLLQHKNPLPTLLALVGFGLLSYSILSHQHNHLLFSLLGAGFIGTAHILNWRISRKVIA